MDVLQYVRRMGRRRPTWPNSWACGTAGVGSLASSRRKSVFVGAYIRRVVRYVLSFLVLCQAMGCGDNTSPTAPTPIQVAGNRAPSVSGAIPEQVLTVGGGATGMAGMDVAPYFVDQDGDTLTYAAVSSDVAVATASVSGSIVMLTPVGVGTATATVTATDPGGLTAAQPVTVMVGQDDVPTTPGSEASPDLVVASPSVSDSRPAAGATFALSVTVRNEGDGDSPATALRYYQSADATVTTSDADVGTDTVAALAASGKASASMDLIAPSAPGRYYYGACVDAVADESDATNNCSTSMQVDVPERAPLTNPDLVVASASVSNSDPAVGATFALSATVRNDGDGESAVTTVRYYRSTESAITTSDAEVGTTAVAELAASGRASASVDLTAPAAGTYYYGACVDAVVGELDSTNNCSTAVQVTVLESTQAPQGDSDLVVVSLWASDSRPAAGAPFTLSATVRNDGVGESQATTLRYYRSTDATITASDTEVGTDAVAPLGASGSGSASVDLTAPSAGTYYYGACVDAVAGESDATNNCSTSVQVDVPEPPPPSRPDLVVASSSVSDSGPAVGAPFTLSATVRNDGAGTSAATTLRYFRSTDATIATSDTAEGTAAVAALAAAASGSESIVITAPSTAGTYYYGACVDSVAGELDSTNNCSTSVQVDVPEPAPLTNPDLVVASASVSNSTPAAGASFTLSATVRNDGDGDAAATTLRYYRSPDATITTSDTAEGSDAVAALAASASGSESIEIAAQSTAGTYYYGACVEAVVGELEITNNCSASVEVTVVEEDTQQLGDPDLAVGSPSVSDDSPQAGAQFTLSTTVRNEGDGAAAATALRYYRSPDATIATSDTAEGSDAVAALAASGSASGSMELTAPSTPGTYYYGACVDAVAGESDTANNCSSSVRVDVESLPPDLKVGAPTVSDSSPVEGGSFTLSATVSNVGEGAAAATTLRYYRSTDATISSSDTEAGTDAVEELSASGSSAESVDLTAPSAAGTYYYGACVDAVAGESDTTDNCSSSVRVDVAAAPPTPASVEVTAPDEWAPVGDTVTFTAHVLDDQGMEIVGASVSWSTSNPSVATVDASGVVTAVSEGTATVTAAATTTASARAFRTAVASTDSVRGSADMEVVKRAARVVMTPNSLSFDEVGDIATLTATVYDANDNEMQPTHWGWSSADREVATVNSRIGSGLSATVQAIGAGSTSVTVHVNGSATGTATVTVTLATARVGISPGSLTFEALGDTKSVTVRILDENGDEDEDATFSYIGGFSPCCGPDARNYLGGVDIDKVDGGLEITAEGPGRGQYTISSEGVESAILLVTVYMKPASVEVSPSSVNLAVDGTTTLSATVKDANGNAIHVNEGDGQGGLVVYWSTSDATVATVDGAVTAERGTTATVTAVGAGTATITGRHGSTITDTASVTVTDDN